MVDDVERDRETHIADAKAFIASAASQIPDALRRDINEGLYTFSELGLFADDMDIKSAELAIQIWALVESISWKGKFPPELRM